ncbi:MAG: ribonuclease Y [Candidatus Sericytochromatia bacterium]|nr:ribonuclease Y [Candidatus Sericytochromatia bacterium]
MLAVAAVIAIVSFVLYKSKSQLFNEKMKDFELKIKDYDQKIKDGNRDVEQRKKEIELQIKEELFEIEQKKKEVVLHGKEELFREKEELEKEIKEKEKRLIQKEENLDKKLSKLEIQEINTKKIEEDFSLKSQKLDELLEKENTELEKIARMNMNEAKEVLLNKVENDLKQEYVQKIKEYDEKTRNDSDKLARKILSQAIQRCAVDHVVESCVSVVTLPSDDMKGRIIGREGRNIRTFENLTGVELVIDDTPEAVVISGFDPVRREIARMALEALVSDGRIHPTRIEEVIEKARNDVDQKIREAGEKTVFELGIQNIHPEIVKTIGRLQYRTSYGQNILQHSKEVSHLAGIMAAELGVNIKLAKRAGLLHDLGKALTHEEEGTHTVLGVELARKYNESPKVLHAMACHHHDIEFETVEAVLVQVADALSAARPGARMEPVENYIKRMGKLEDIANSFPGIEKCFVMQAGREIRIMVQPDAVNDEYAPKLARDIAEKIEAEMEYPGQVKITVIRETRATNFAK